MNSQIDIREIIFCLCVGIGRFFKEIDSLDTLVVGCDHLGNLLNQGVFKIINEISSFEQFWPVPPPVLEGAFFYEPDLVLLDIVLSDDVDGYQMSQQMREFSYVSIIMLTAKARESDVLEGFDSTADDYITIPSSAKELLARVQSILKRSIREASEVTDVDVFCGPLYIDLARRRVTRDHEEIQS